ncbi:alpha/beta hydrolase-fold protein [Xanthocytophaga agilis]|uniref:Alpha/beta hydrolase-fold protein n=1 Tax=Xanthocytophaga agilis TaxID=3048010 RepID=A0AAE3UD21_9BACT|nr:alpha/beta hydrolase-fold protein [Xanthocytophaga agilis]MDJ1501403.1 alpha/beta hydrolase-fold protein [Xanthocytophaga agilis]
MTSSRTLSLIILSLLIIRGTYAQTLPSGPQVLTFFSNADDTEQPYGLYLPKNYNPQKKYPLVVMLHGAGSNHRLELRRVFGKSNAPGETDVEASLSFPEWKDVEYIVVSPYARGTAGYQGIPENDVYDVLADAKKRFSIDEDRVYLTGLSMGGGGTLWIGLSRPDIWAAIAPVCPAPPKGTQDLAMNALNFPVHFFHGDADPVVPVAGTRDWVKKLTELGTKVEYKEFPGVQHDSWVGAYKDEFIFGWFDQFKRNRFPGQVRFATRQYKYNRAYWVRLDQFTPGTLASIDARFTAPNELMIKTSALDAFTLTLTGHPKFVKAGKPLAITINDKKIKVPALSSEFISLQLQNGKWSVVPTPVASAKKQGEEGPLSEAFAARHIYIYGTGGNPTPEELKARQDIALQAANWSTYRGEFLGRIMFFPRVLSDKEVRPSDLESSNLILFGTKETNLLIEKYSDRLPLQLNATAAKDHGLFYVFPVDKHYVAVNSGLPWWTGLKPEGYPFLPPAQRVLGDFKDFILFKDSVRNVVAEGYFGTNWKPSESEAKKIAALGVVSLR